MLKTELETKNNLLKFIFDFLIFEIIKLGIKVPTKIKRCMHPELKEKGKFLKFEEYWTLTSSMKVHSKDLLEFHIVR